MPRRATPDPTAKAVGERIRLLRLERGLTAERLAFESELQSKGFLSDIERGLAVPSLRTLQVIADHLEIPLVDLFTFPERSERERLIERTRTLTPGSIRKLLRDIPGKLPTAAEPAPRREKGPARGGVEPYDIIRSRTGRNIAMDWTRVAMATGTMKQGLIKALTSALAKGGRGTRGLVRQGPATPAPVHSPREREPSPNARGPRRRRR
jgi:transcriptional regulator with XRE-family HTH domain